MSPFFNIFEKIIIIMRKINYQPIIGLLFFASCSTNPSEIEVSSLETLCDHVEALGEIYDEMEEIMGVTRMDERAFEVYNKLWAESEEFMALDQKEDEIKYSMTHNSFKFSESAIYNCPNGREIALWMDK